ncbi:MAG: hypothetical protein AAFR16_07195, partial [Pseudomonadota bacterium]
APAEIERAPDPDAERRLSDAPEQPVAENRDRQPEPDAPDPNPPTAAERPENAPREDAPEETRTAAAPDRAPAPRPRPRPQRRAEATPERAPEPEPEPAEDSLAFLDAAVSAGRGQATPTGPKRLTADLREGLQAQLRACWNPPVGRSEEVRVAFELAFTRAGAFAAAPKLLTAVDSAKRELAARRALQALYDCEPFAFPPDRFDDWGFIILEFDPARPGGAG